MVEHAINWAAIRAEYEAGKGSLRSLADKYGVSKTTLIRKRNNEGWTTDRTTGPRTGPIPPPVHDEGVIRFLLPNDVLSIADLLLTQLARNLQMEMDIRDIKLASDALASCAKVKLTYPAEQEDHSSDGIVLWPERLLPHTQAEIRRLLEADEQKQREERVG